MYDLSCERTQKKLVASHYIIIYTILTRFYHIIISFFSHYDKIYYHTLTRFYQFYHVLSLVLRVVDVYSLFQWIGLRENLQETIDFPIKYGAFL